MKLNNKVALVTGANRGIGKAAVKGLRDLGAEVVMACRNVESGEEARRELGGERLTVIACDVDSEESINACRAEVEKRFGKLHILVNNAGIFPEAGRGVLEQSEESIRATFETNLLGQWRMCRAFVPLMKRTGEGKIINVSSGLAQLSTANSGRHIGYRLSKAALNMLSRTLAAELAPDHIQVNAMAPGWVHTRMGGKEAPRAPEEGADTIVWLAAQGPDGPTGKFFEDRKEIPW